MLPQKLSHKYGAKSLHGGINLTRRSIAFSAGLLLVSPALTLAQQAVDPAFMPSVSVPEYSEGEGPSVFIDAAHLNHDTADGSYLPFAEVLRVDGYTVTSNRTRFNPDTLADADVLVIANAMHEQSEHDWAPLPSFSAFSETEIRVVERWVSDGGSLLLIADHMPLSGHSSELAAAFGILFHNGFAYDDATRNPQITFSRSASTLADNTITNGRDASENIESVTTYTGQAFRLSPDVAGEPLLIFPKGSVLLVPEVAWEFSESTPQVPADYLLQGAILQHGEGRVAVFGEAAMFGARLAGQDEVPIGMNAPDARWNEQFAINVMHWLSGAL